jgi:hypothetical protein
MNRMLTSILDDFLEDAEKQAQVFLALSKRLTRACRNDTEKIDPKDIRNLEKFAANLIVISPKKTYILGRKSNRKNWQNCECFCYPHTRDDSKGRIYKVFV